MANSSFFKNTGTSVQLSTSVQTLRDEAQTFKNDAETAKTAAETAQTASETAKTASETAKSAAQTARTEALGYKNEAATSATNAATSETNAATSATTATNQASTATTKAGEATTSASAAATDATTASTKATEAATSATNAATSETNAETAKTAAETAKTGAETAKTAAETAKTAAETAKTGAETAQTAAETAETNASTSATTASTKATEASTSATNAAASATTASTKASEASTSAAAAAASQTAAAASAASAASTYDQFDDRYLGVAASDPSTDNDGNALVEGALYFSSTDNAMQVYDGSEWIAASAAGSVSITETHFTATAGQTTFNVSYTVDNLVVIMNGVVLQNGASKDYTATNGTSFTLASGAAAGDELHVIVFKSFTTADMVSKTNGGTYSGSVDFTGGIEIDGTAVTATAAELNTLDGITATTTELNLLDGVTATTAEINYLDGVTSNIQTQIDGISSEVVDDTTPSLGGNLDVAGNEITAAISNGDIVLSTSGTGNVKTVRGSTASSISGSALAFNRSVGDGEIYDNTNNAFQFNHDSNKLALQVYNSSGTTIAGNAINVDSTGLVGLGTNTQSSYDSRANNLVVGDSGDSGITIFSGSSSDGRLVFAQSGDTGLSNGAIHYDQSNDVMSFDTGGSSRMQIKGDGTWGKAPPGTILQVKQQQLSSIGSVSLAAETWTNWPSLYVNITPKSTSSKILVMVTAWGEIISNAQDTTYAVKRGSTVLTRADDSNRHGGLATPLISYHLDNDSTAECGTFQYLDSPSTTSSTTYQVVVRAADAKTLYYNRTAGHANNAYREVYISTITVMEVAG